MIDPYSFCSCGSGKKHKWCCQAIQPQIDKVYALDEQGQHEAAMRLMDEIAAEHPTNHVIWGRKAQLQFMNERPAEAEATLDKAFELNPSYAFGAFLKAQFRLFDGDIAAALVLFRKAADLYDPLAGELLAQIYIQIFECEMRLNHPIAARAAVELAAHFHPTSGSIRDGIDKVFAADNPNLPASAARKYAFLSLPASAPAERRTAWEAALTSSATGKLPDATRAFEQLTQTENADPAAWFNLGLCQAWAGDSTAALTSLDRYVALETDETRAAQAWALGEVLRMGQGMEDQADVVENVAILVLQDPTPLVNLINELHRDKLLVGPRQNEQNGSFTATLLDPPGPALTPELQARQGAKIAAYLLMDQNIVQLRNVNREALDRLVDRLKEKLGAAIAQSETGRGPAPFAEYLSEAIALPMNASSKEEVEERLREGYIRYFEDQWPHRPLKSLGGSTPADASGDATLRKKLRGVIQFMSECGLLTKVLYDFDRLRHKLGLGDAPAAPAAAAATGPRRDYSALSAAEAASLDTASLSSAELDQAYLAAVKLEARELAGKFAADLVSRPAYPERPDRFPLFQLLINQSLTQGDTTAALDRVNDGEKDDCENNGGKRRNDYELRRAQVHAKGGDFAEAEAVFDRLIERVPDALNVRVSAVEMMLSGRQPAKARKFAEQGLAAAVKLKNRDLEGHFKELLAASQK